MSGIPACEVTVQPEHMDSYGHVNNAAYLTLYEEARWQLISPRGFSMQDIHRMKQGPVVLEANVKFLRELKLGDVITITTETLSYEGKIGRMLQKMIKADGTVASEAVFVYGLFDLERRKLIDPTPEWKAAIGISD